MLTVLFETSKRRSNGKIIWECLCDCGNIVERIPSDLANSAKRSVPNCGCVRRKKMASTDPDKNHLLSQTKAEAKRRGIKWSLTNEEAFNLFLGNCHYCDTPPSNNFRNSMTLRIYKYNGIDRLNNNDDYNYSNCVSCCRQCNIGKRTLSHDEFLQQILRIYNRFLRRETIFNERACRKI